MGYESNFELSVKKISSDGNLINVTEQEVILVIDAISDQVGHNIFYREQSRTSIEAYTYYAKWHDWKYDIQQVSLCWPRFLISALRIGEESDDIEQLYAFGGQYYTEKAKIIYPVLNMGWVNDITENQLRAQNKE